jgi:non-specific serine/threonine protein kinase
MVGLDSVRRAALALREWPGPLQPADARQLGLLIERCKRAGRAAVLLRPAGYDGEVVYLITLLQSLGRLALHYHFPDEAEQIHRLQQPAPSSQAGEPDEPGMSEGAAAHAVLGADVEALAAVVARHCGLDAGALTMIRRHPLTTTVHDPEGDAELLRTVASCANEAVEAMAQPAARVQSALERVVLRYGRVLEIGLRELHAALNGQTAAVVAERPTAVLDAPPVPAARGGQLRAAAAARGRPGDPDAARGGGGQAAG